MWAMVSAVNCHGASAAAPAGRDDDASRIVDEVDVGVAAGAVVGDRLQSDETDVVENAAQEMRRDLAIRPAQQLRKPAEVERGKRQCAPIAVPVPPCFEKARMASRGFCRRRNASAAGGLPPWTASRRVRVARISSSPGTRMRHLPRRPAASPASATTLGAQLLQAQRGRIGAGGGSGMDP